jgi:hypothetical protein
VAATAHFAVPAKATSPLALWHLLSLDAPAVAALWTWFVARAVNVRLPLASPVAMALAVWILYAADRLLDARLLDEHSANAWTGEVASHVASPYDRLEARHLFHHRHRPAFASAIVAAALALAALLPALNPAAIRLSLVEGTLLAAWFLVLHATHSAHRLPKEIAVGLFFSAAVFIPTVAREPALRPGLMPIAAIFAALCSLNCLFIYAWEHGDPTLANLGHRPANCSPPHPTTRIALAHLTALNLTLTISAVALAVLYSPSVAAAAAEERLVPCACALSAALLLLLHRIRHRLSRVHLRAAADLALLTPLLLLPFMR